MHAGTIGLVASALIAIVGLSAMSASALPAPKRSEVTTASTSSIAQSVHCRRYYRPYRYYRHRHFYRPYRFYRPHFYRRCGCGCAGGC